MDLYKMEGFAKKMRRLEDFEGPADEWLASIGKP
jgi:hypothetical protein